MPDDAPLSLPSGTRRRLAQRSLVILGLSTVGVGAAVALLSGLGHSEVATGILIGHLLAHALTVTWVAGALLTWAASQHAFMLGTIGAFPIRLLVVMVGVLTAHDLGLHVVAVVVSMVITQILGHGVEIWIFCALADASVPAAPGVAEERKIEG